MKNRGFTLRGKRARVLTRLHRPGMRGDKVRTVAIQRDDVVDHRTGKRMSAKAYLRGAIDNLW